MKITALKKSALWYVNSRTCSTIDDILSPDGHSVHTNIEKLKIFNQFFSSVFTEKDLSHILAYDLDPVPSLIIVSLSFKLVFKKLKELTSSSKSPGPEGRPVAVLKVVAAQICSLYT